MAFKKIISAFFIYSIVISAQEIDDQEACGSVSGCEECLKISPDNCLFLLATGESNSTLCVSKNETETFINSTIVSSLDSCIRYAKSGQ